MSKKSIAILESTSFLDALNAVGTLLGETKVTLAGRYLLGQGKVAIVFKGEPEAISSVISIVENRLGDMELKTGVIHDFPRKAMEMMLAPHDGFHPVFTVRESTPVEKLAVGKEVGTAADLDGLYIVMSPEGPTVSFERVSGLTSKRKKRLSEVLQYFWANKNQKITSNEVARSMDHIPKPTLGRDLDYLSQSNLIGKEGRGRATYYLYKPLETRDRSD